MSIQTKLFWKKVLEISHLSNGDHLEHFFSKKPCARLRCGGWRFFAEFVGLGGAAWQGNLSNDKLHL